MTIKQKDLTGKKEVANLAAGLLTPKKVINFFKEYAVKGRNGEV